MIDFLKKYEGEISEMVDSPNIEIYNDGYHAYLLKYIVNSNIDRYLIQHMDTRKVNNPMTKVRSFNLIWHIYDTHIYTYASQWTFTRITSTPNYIKN